MITKLGKSLEVNPYSSERADRLMNHMGIDKDSVRIFQVNSSSPVHNKAVPVNFYKGNKKRLMRDAKNEDYRIREALLEGKNVITLSKNDKYLPHELGHLTGSFVNDKKAVEDYQKSVLYSTLAGALPASSAFLWGGIQKKPFKHIGAPFSLASLALAAPALKEEFKASKEGVKAVYETEGLGSAVKSGLSFLPGQSTYLLAPALPYAAGRLGHRLLRNVM